MVHGGCPWHTMRDVHLQLQLIAKGRAECFAVRAGYNGWFLMLVQCHPRTSSKHTHPSPLSASHQRKLLTTTLQSSAEKQSDGAKDTGRKGKYSAAFLSFISQVGGDPRD